MKVKVLNLEELADEILRVEYPTYENAPSGMRDAIVRKKRRIKEVLEQHLKSVLGFYLKYESMPELLLKEHPELADVEIRHGTNLKEFAEHYYDYGVDDVWLNCLEFNEWLIRYVFREVASDVEKEISDEQWKLFTELHDKVDE